MMCETAPDAIITMDGQGRISGWNPEAGRVFGCLMVGGRIASIVPEQHRDVIECEIQRFLAAREDPSSKRIEITAVERDGHEVPVELTIAFSKVAETGLFTAFIRDVSARMRAEVALEHRARAASFVTEIGAILTQAEKLRSGLQRCAEVVVRHTEGAFARIWTLNKTTNELELEASAGMYTHIDGAHSRIPVGHFKIGRIAQRRQPHLSNDVPNDPEVSDREWAKREQMVGFAGYPLMVDNRVVGVAAVFARRPFTEMTVQALGWIAEGMAQFIERKRTETELRDREERISLLLDSAPQAIFGIDLNGLCTFANRSCLRLLGYKRAEALIGKNIHTLIHHSHADRSEYPNSECRIYQAFMQGEHCHVDDEVLWCADGRSFPVEYWSHPVMKEGTVVGSLITFLDITERKQAADERWKLVSLIENSDDFIGLASPELKVEFLNDGGCRLIGIDTPQQALGKDISLFFADSNWARVKDQVIPAMMQGGRWKGELQLRNFKTGSFVDVSVQTSLIRRAETGEILSLATIMRDISDRKRVEAEWNRAREAAEAANRSKSEFLANMSHEIRTPMNGIIGMIELLLDTQLSATQRDYFDTIKSSADSLLTVIKDILDLSQIEAGRFEIDPVRFNLRENLDETTRALSLRAHEKGLDLFCEFKTDVPDYLIGDPISLRRVIGNLLSNAIKFTQRGEVAVQVGLHSCLGDRVKLRFTVRDTGIGIPDEKQKLIFEAFSQADGSMSRKYGGTGLGLTIAARLVEAMQGQIWVDSKPHQGSSFHFTAQFGADTARGKVAPTDLVVARTPVLVADRNSAIEGL